MQAPHTILVDNHIDVIAIQKTHADNKYDLMVPHTQLDEAFTTNNTHEAIVTLGDMLHLFIYLFIYL